VTKFVYSGPSWAAQSFDTLDGNETNTTNLLELWGLQDIAINTSERGSNFNIQYDKFVDSNLPVIYVSCETLAVFDSDTRYTKSYTDDWYKLWDMRSEVNKANMDKLSKLDNPVAVIGAHTDVSDVPDNVTIIDSSWQNFLRQEAGLDAGYNWGCEILHRHMMLGNFIDFYKNNLLLSKSSKFIIDRIQTQFVIWEKLQQHNLFFGAHPNTRGNELYAKHTKDKVLNFLGL